MSFAMTLLVLGAQAANVTQLPQTTPISPMVFSCMEGGADWWELLVSKKAGADHIEIFHVLNQKHMEQISLSDALKSIRSYSGHAAGSFNKDVDGKIYEALYQDAHASNDNIIVKFFAPTGESIRSLTFAWQHDKKIFEQHCIIAPTPPSGWEDRQEVWK